MQRSVCISSLPLPSDDTGDGTLMLMLTHQKLKPARFFPVNVELTLTLGVNGLLPVWRCDEAK